MKTFTEKLLKITLLTSVASMTFYLIFPFSFHIPFFNTFTFSKIAGLLFLFSLLLGLLLKKIEFKIPYETYPFLGVVILGIIVALFSGMNSGNIKTSVNSFAGFLVMIGAYSVFRKQPGIKKSALTILLAGGITHFFFMIFEYATLNQINGFWELFRSRGGTIHWNVDGYYRASALLPFPNHLAFFIFFWMPVFTTYFYLKKEGKTRLLLAAFFLVAITLAVAYSRTFTVSSLIFLALLYIMTYVIRTFSLCRKKILFVLSVFLIAFIINFTLSPFAAKRIISFEKTGSFKERLLVMKSAVKMLKDSRWMGSGFYSFRDKLQNDPRYTFKDLNPNVTQPHCMYLSVAIASGLAGLILFLVFLFLMLRRLYKGAASGSVPSLVFFCWLAAYTAAMLLYGEFYTIENSFDFGIVMSLLLAASEETNS